MKLFPPALQIGLEEGFDPSKDLFGRKSLGDGLTSLVGDAGEPLVIAVDGQWGSGKTTFLKMWAGELRKTNFPVVYFDAFAHDYVEDAFSAIAGEIVALAAARKKLETTKGKRFLDSAVKMGKVVGKVGLKIGVKAATLGILSGTELVDVADEFGNAAEEAAESLLGKLLTKRNEDYATIQEFRQALSNLPEVLCNAPSEELRPLVFIID